MPRVIRVENPPDLTGTYDYTRLYATSTDVSNGTFNMVASAAIDTATPSYDWTGYTDVTYSAGTSAMHFKATWYATATSSETDQTDSRDQLRGDTPRLRKKALQDLRDTDNAVWTTDEMDNIVQQSVDALFPHVMQSSIDNSMVTSANVRSYNMPAGWYRIDELYIGSITAGDYTEYQNYKNVGRKIILGDTPSISAKTITLYGAKKFTHAWEVPLAYEAILLLYIKAEALQMLVLDRAKFKAYVELVKDKDLRPAELTTLATNLRALFEKRLADIARTGHTTEMTEF